MSASPPIESEVVRTLAEGRTNDAVAAVLEAHGPEVLGYLVERLRDPTVAREVFGRVEDDLLRGLPDFQGRSTLRTWLFVLARNALARACRDEDRRLLREQMAGALQPSAVDPVSDRTPTPLHRRTTIKERVRLLRQSLTDDEQLLLYLRVDRAMSWNELVGVMFPDEPATATERLSARLRQRLADLKRKLRRLAQQDGLVDAPR